MSGRNMTTRKTIAILCLLVAIPSHVMAQQAQSGEAVVADFQSDFAAAYNRGDVDAADDGARTLGRYEREQFGIDDVGVGRAEAVRQPLVDLEGAALQQLAERGAESAMGTI
jgi:hypothetical protein